MFVSKIAKIIIDCYFNYKFILENIIIQIILQNRYKF